MAGWKPAPRGRLGQLNSTQRFWQREMYVLFPDGDHFDGGVVFFDDPVNALFDNGFRRACASGDHYRFNTFEPRLVNVGDTVDQMRIDSRLSRQLSESLAVGAVLAAEYQTQLSITGDFANGFLSVCVA